MKIQKSAGPLGWKKTFLWLVFIVICFQIAYTPIRFSAAGLVIFGFAYGLVRLTDQPNVRRAFYFGLAAGFLCYAPQLFFFWRIFNAASIVLWLVLAFWLGLFTSLACGCILRWGKFKTVWLIPIIWTGLEYFRSELNYLKFSWLNIGYALPPGCNLSRGGMYGAGFMILLAISVFYHRRFIFSRLKETSARVTIWILVFFLAVAVVCLLLRSENRLLTGPEVKLVGIQMEFPSENIIPKMLNNALAKNTDAAIFVLSEYTLDGQVPDSLKSWCREHSRYLVIGGKDCITNDLYYNTAFVVGTNGEVIFKQAKSVPIQFFHDGLPAPTQNIWNSPWGKIGIGICYDLSYTRVTDELVRQGAQLLIVPTMDVDEWGRHQHELHSRVAPVRAAEYGIPIFRVASSGISQAVSENGYVVRQTSIPGNGEIFSAQLRLPPCGSLPWDRFLTPFCVGATGIIMAALLILAWNDKRSVK